MTPETAAAIMEKVKDRDWRMANLYQIIDEDGNVKPYNARTEQLQYRREAVNLNFVPKARKLGMSTEVVLGNLDECWTTPNFRAAIVDKSEPDAYDKLQIARFAWENGPKHPEPHIAALWQRIHTLNKLVTDNDGELSWINGSRFEAGVSFTGGTIQSLHVSELGPIAAQRPAKAAEIRRGSMNAVPPSGRITVETTMEGGRIGVCYELFEQAKAACTKADFTPLDWRLHFFSWLGHPSYSLPGRAPIMADTMKYFQELTAKYGDWMEAHFGWRIVPDAKQAWWEGKKATLKDEMCQQYPSVVDECDMAVVVGAIFPEMNSVRAQRRIRPLNVEKGPPLWSFWDLGTEDAVAGWLIQECGRDICVLDWSAGEGVGAAGVAAVLTEWTHRHGVISAHYLPHDADTREKGSGLSYRQQLAAAGVAPGSIRVVQRTPNVWAGIDEVRKLMPRMYFNADRCDVQVTVNGEKLPGGCGRLEAYRKQQNKQLAGGFRGIPFKDGVCDHSADALRTYAEARTLNLLLPLSSPQGGLWTPPQVLGARASL